MHHRRTHSKATAHVMSANNARCESLLRALVRLARVERVSERQPAHKAATGPTPTRQNAAKGAQKAMIKERWHGALSLAKNTFANRCSCCSGAYGAPFVLRSRRDQCGYRPSFLLFSPLASPRMVRGNEKHALLCGNNTPTVRLVSRPAAAPLVQFVRVFFGQRAAAAGPPLTLAPQGYLLLYAKRGILGSRKEVFMR